jgi:uncharacterized protein (PEP-CTERM system associated)
MRKPVFTLRLCVTALMLIPVSGIPVQADPWTFRPSVSLDESYTDNIRLAPDGAEESELVTTLTPGLLLEREGRRLDLSALYRLQGVFYRDNSTDNRSTNLLDANATGEILRNRLFIETSATSREQNISNTGAIAADNISLGENRARVVTYSASPYWREQFGSTLDTELRYERNTVKSSRSLDSDNDIFSLDLTSGSAFARLLWEAHASNEKISYQTGDTTRFRTIDAEAKYLLTEKFALTTLAGYDDNDYTTNTGKKNDGARWRAGAVYKPSRRTSVEAGVGRRYFGTDIFVELSHQARRTRWFYTYFRQPDSTRSILLEQPVFALTDLFGNPVADPLGSDQLSPGLNVPVQTAEVILRERMNGSFNYTNRNNSLDLSFFSEDREYQLTGLKDESDGANAGWTWNINRTTRSRLGVNYSTNLSSTNLRQDFRVIEYRLTRTFAREVEAGLVLRNVHVDADSGIGSYTQNTITATLSKQF